MLSDEDAHDDEWESPARISISKSIESNNIKFTVFVVQPNEDVCALRHLPSGIRVLEVKCKLELLAGVPFHLYKLVHPNGEELHDDQRLIVKENIQHGHLLRLILYEQWESLYFAVIKNNIEISYYSGGEHDKGKSVIGATDADLNDDVKRERGAVALFMAAYHGMKRTISMLVSAGVNVNSSTRFGRTPLQAAVANDRVAIVEMLINQGADVAETDQFKCTALDVAKQMFAALCIQKLRQMKPTFCGNTGNLRQNMNRLALDVTSNSQISNYSKTSTQRTCSKSSIYSDLSSVRTYTKFRPLHDSRKYASSSAITLHNTGNCSIGRDAYTVRSHREVGEADFSKRNEQLYYAKNHSNSCRSSKSAKEQLSDVFKDVINVMPAKFTDNLKISKFVGPRTTSENGGKSSDCSFPKDGENSEKKKDAAGNEQHIVEARRMTKKRLRHFQSLSKKEDDYVPMDSRTKANHNKDRLVVSEAYKRWLEKKDAVIEDSTDDTSSSENVLDSDSEEDILVKFNKRVRKMNRMESRCLTPGNRPVKNLINIGSLHFGEHRNSPSENYITAYNEWRRKNREYLKKLMKHRTVNDCMQEKKHLEEKRQKLLMKAITYEEWMSYTEERQFLEKQILQSVYDDMKMIEGESLKGKQHLRSNDLLWKKKSLNTEQKEKNKKLCS